MEQGKAGWKNVEKKVVFCHYSREKKTLFGLFRKGT